MSNLKRNKRVSAALAGITTAAMLFSSVPASALTMTYTPSDSYRNNEYYEKLTDVVLTGNQRVDIANVAMSQLGYHESDSPSDLSGTSSDGSSNYTEYGSWYGYQCDWCAIFIAWCAGQAQVPTTTIAKQARAGGIYSTSASGNYGGSFTQFSMHVPQTGDIAYMDNDGDGRSDHVELVYAVTDTTILTIGGNTSGWDGVMVNTHSFPRSSGDTGYQRIIGFETPDYAGQNDPVSTADTETGIAYPRPTRVLSKGSNGADVCWLQVALNMVDDAGLEVDGIFGSASDAAVKTFQASHGLDASGSVGSATVQAIVDEILSPPVEQVLTVTYGDASMKTLFNWEEVSGAERYELLIWKGSYGEGDPYYTEYDLNTTSIEIALPAGNYEAALKTVMTASESETPVVSFSVSDIPSTEPPVEEETPPAEVGTPTPAYLLGDVNGDGQINAIDASYILAVSAAMGTSTDVDVSPEFLAAADFNEDGYINAVDASLILQYSAQTGV